MSGKDISSTLGEVDIVNSQRRDSEGSGFHGGSLSLLACGQAFGDYSTTTQISPTKNDNLPPLSNYMGTGCHIVHDG